MTGVRSLLTNFVHKFLGTVKFGNDQVAKIMGIVVTNKVPLREPIPLEVIAQESVSTKVYTRRPNVPKTNFSNSKPKIAKSMISKKTEPDTSQGSNTLVAPSSSSSIDLMLSKIFCVPVAAAPRAVDLPNSHVSTSIDQDAPSTNTLMVKKNKLDEDLQGIPIDATLYCGMIGSLMLLTSKRPNLIYVVCLCAWYQAKPTEKHLNMVKRIFRYLKGTINMGLWYSKDTDMSLTAYTDANHVGCQDIIHNTSGSAQFLGDKLVSWSSKKQKSTTILSTEAEYIALTRSMNPTSAEQIALDNTLVTLEARLTIGKCNNRISFSKPQREATYQVTLDALKLSPCYPTHSELYHLQDYTYASGAKELKKVRKFKKPASPKLKIVPVSPKEPTNKPAKKTTPAKKSSKSQAGVIIKDTPGVSVSKKKAPEKGKRSKVIEIL
nr:uncharacterized mitochondrial protein AtMg00810-like [Tanacetum cinerariifolium]